MRTTVLALVIRVKVVRNKTCSYGNWVSSL
jgi:hypothetical protein